MRSLARAGLIGAMLVGGGAAAAAERPRLYTNESYVEDITRAAALDLADIKAVFAYVLESLPGRVKVYPTENYYYFSFYAGGLRYAGNIRLEIVDRAEPDLHFTYYEDLSEWQLDTPVQHAVLGKADGVAVEKLEPLVYRVSHAGTSVTFALNDLSGVKPPPAALAPDDKYLGTSFDESGLRFFFLYNQRLKLFHFVLDETVAEPEQFAPLARTRILIGRRTGFAFYRDHHRERKILVGAYEGNVRVNNYFDGPFDQLPDNFIEGESLRAAILEIEPGLKGKIDRLGSSPDGSSRYPIMPYMNYGRPDDLRVVDRCAEAKKSAPDYAACFVVEDESRLPRALEKRPPKSKRR